MACSLSRTLALAALLFASLFAARVAKACPFCSAVTQTLGEELRGSDVGVVARLISMPEPVADDPGTLPSSLDTKPSKFAVDEVLKGGELLGGKTEIEVTYFGDSTPGALFLIMGSDPAQVAFATPVPLTEAASEYVRQLPKLPAEGPERLVFFQKYLEHPEQMLAQDSYDEFAKAPYATIKEFRPHMQHDWLVSRIQDKTLSASRRRLFLTMLGVCGGPEDLPLLEQLIATKDPELRTTLDAMVAAYLNLKGPEGMPLVENLFFKDPSADFTDTYSALVALRFHGQESTVVPRERLIEAFRLMLDRPQYADLVIPDLARWEDWASLPRLVQLFETANDESSWVRTPVIQFLRVCPLPEAQTEIARLEKIDPEAVKRANSFLPFATATAQAPVPLADVSTPASDPAASSAVATSVGPAEAASIATAPDSTSGNSGGTVESPLPADGSSAATAAAEVAADVVQMARTASVPTTESAPVSQPTRAAPASTAEPPPSPTETTTATVATASAPPVANPATSTEVPGVSRPSVFIWALTIALGVFVLLVFIVFVGNNRQRVSQ